VPESFKQAFGNGRLAVILKVLSLSLAAGSAIGVGVATYASLRSDIATNRQALDDLEKDIDRLANEQGRWNTEEKSYDAETRKRIDDVINGLLGREKVP